MQPPAQVLKEVLLVLLKRASAGLLLDLDWHAEVPMKLVRTMAAAARRRLLADRRRCALLLLRCGSGAAGPVARGSQLWP